MGAHTNSRQRRSAASRAPLRRAARHRARQRRPAWRAAEPPSRCGAAQRGATDCCCPSAKRPVPAACRRCCPGGARAARRSRPAARSRVRRGRTRRPACVEPTSGTVPRHTQSLGDAAQQPAVHVRLRGAVAQRDMRFARGGGQRASFGSALETAIFARPPARVRGLKGTSRSALRAA